MVSIYSVDPNKLIESVAEELKKISDINPPEWASFVKTGVSKERPPIRDDWWYVRAAAILRSVYKMGPIGVNKLRTKYGGIKNRGVRPEKFFIGGGNIIRKVMQQLEKAELIKKGEVGVHKGKVIAPKGKSIVDKAAVQIYKSMPKPQPIAEEVKKAAPKKEAKEEKPAEKKEEAKAEAKPEEKPKAKKKKAAPKKEGEDAKPEEKKEEPKKEDTPKEEPKKVKE